ncbi:MAG TPA: CARDB domain-containing protein [Candidatus Thermoplasmatota archaeon]|nr:CARDB domain-containing protein [Candidatus Thermoplasmatota archaeon]
MGFQDQAGGLFSIGLVAVALGGALLPALHPLFDIGEGGVGSDEAGALTGRFIGETLTDKTLRNCEIRDAKLVRVETQNCQIYNSEIVDSRIRSGSVVGSRASLTAFKSGTLQDGVFDNVTVDGSKITGTQIRGLIMQGGSLTDVTLVGGTVENTAVTGGSLKWVTLRSSKAESVAVAKDARILESSVENYTLQGGRAEASTLMNVGRHGTEVVNCNVLEADLVVRRVAREGGGVVAIVANTGRAAAPYFEVVLFTNGNEVGRTLVKNVPAGGEARVSFPMGGGGSLRVVADAADRIPEANEGNNEASA